MDDISVLIVDDNRELTQWLQISIKEAEGWAVYIAETGEAALEYLKQSTPTVAVLDIKLPGISGIDLLKHMVSHDSTSGIRVIMISGYGDEDQRVSCLKMGAADYLPKVFKPFELIHHIKLVLGLLPEKTSFTRGIYIDRILKIDFHAHLLTVNGQESKLTPTEWKILEELVHNAGKTQTYIQLLHKVWGSDYGNDKGLLHANVSRLRSKIDPDPQNARYIITVPGIGYRFQATETLSTRI